MTPLVTVTVPVRVVKRFPTADGQFGQGIALDGVDQFVETPVENEEMFDFQDGTGFSISAWFTVDSFNKSWQALIAKGEGNRWRVHRRGGESVFTANGGSGDVSRALPMSVMGRFTTLYW